MKSTQKNKKRYTSLLNVGIRERIATECPPDMTDSMKTAILKEIEEFDHDATQKARYEAGKSAAGSASIDAYQEWLEHNAGHEPAEANPDIVPEENGIQYITSKKDSEIQRLLKEFRQSLTGLQLQVWNLVMKHQLSIGQTARILNKNRSNVQDALRRARIKFQLFGEAFARV